MTGWTDGCMMQVLCMHTYVDRERERESMHACIHTYIHTYIYIYNYLLI